MRGTLLLFSFFITFKSLSQDTASNHAQTLSSISFFRSGGETIYFNYPQFQELLQMTSLSIFPSPIDSFSTYHLSSGPFWFSQFSGCIGFRTQSGRMKNSKNEWQIGISYANSSREMRPFSFHHNVVIPGDTLTSGNVTVISDTTASSFYQYYIAMNELAFDGARILNADLLDKWRFSSGIGVQAGFTINSTVRAIHGTYSVAETFINGNFSSSSLYSQSPAEQEKKNLKSSIFIRSYLPFGVSFRLAKKQWWLHSFSFAVKSTFGVEYLHINQTGYFNPYWTAGAGIVYTPL